MRVAWLKRLFLAALGVLCGALVILQLVFGVRYRRAAEQNRIRLIPMPAVRGSILDRHGAPIAEDRLTFHIAIVPQDVRDLNALWEPLSRALQQPVTRLQRAYRRGYAAPFAPIVVARAVRPPVAFALEERRLQLPGVMVLPAPQRHYPVGRSAGAVIGYLGLVSPDQLKSLKSYGYTFRDWVGQQGIERLYDAALRGGGGGVQVEVDHRGRLIRQLGFKQPTRGKDVAVTLDAALQRRCYELLAERRGAIAVMALDTGEMWAVVSSPGFDPGAFVDPDREEEVLECLRDPDRPLFNRAVAGAVPPGSVFKVVTAYAGLAARRGSATTTYVCPGSFHLGQATFDCWYAPGHGPQTVVEALTHSCNVFFYQWGLRVGPQEIAGQARRFGFGRPTGVDLPGEQAGFVPDPAWKRARHHQPWYRGETVNLAIGQGALLATPMQVLQMMAAAAHDGRVPQPHLLKGMAGHPVDPPPPTIVPLDHQALAVVREGLQAVVESPTGTGRLARIPGIPAAGKTGTAQGPPDTWPHAWFCGYVPAAAPQMAVVVFVEHGGKGGEVAATIAGRIFEMLQATGVVG